MSCSPVWTMQSFTECSLLSPASSWHRSTHSGFLVKLTEENCNGEKKMSLIDTDNLYRSPALEMLTH